MLTFKKRAELLKKAATIILSQENDPIRRTRVIRSLLGIVTPIDIEELKEIGPNANFISR